VFGIGWDAVVGAIWKPVGIGLIGLLLFTWGYQKGKHHCEAGVEHTTLVETTNRVNDYNKTKTNLGDKISKIVEDRSKGKNDKRDSCLLSNNPFEVDCLKK
jgi:hypothetical protein